MDANRPPPTASPSRDGRAAPGLVWVAGFLTAGGLLLALVLFGTGDRPPTGPTVNPMAVRFDAPKPAPRPPVAADPQERILLAGGWDPESARAVLAFHADFLAALSADSPAVADAVLKWLAVLGKFPNAHSLLRAHPEHAGLLAAVTDADAAARALGAAGDDVPALVNALLLALDRPAQDDAVAVFARHGHRIARLQSMGVFGVEALFPAAPSGDADRAFDRWLADALDAAAGDDDRLAAVVLLAREQGPALRARLAADATFRARFEGLWAALARVCSDPRHPLELYLDEPAVWDVLLRPGGEELVRRRGLLAVALLHGPKGYPKPLHDRVAGLLLAGDAVTVTGLLDGPFREHPQFRDLLAAPLPDDLLARAVADLLAAGPTYAAPLLKFWPLRATPAALAAALASQGPGAFEWVPFYTAAVVAGKLVTGERVSDDEWAGVGVEAVVAVVPVARLGGPVVTQSLRRAATETAARRLGKTAFTGAGTASAREVKRWSMAGLMTQPRQVVGAAGRRLSVEVTSAVRAAYHRAGVGRAWFRRATGLEARVFLRRDARVVIHLDRLAFQKTAKYLTDRATAAIDADTADTPAGRDAATASAAAVALLDAVELPVPAPEAPR